MPVCPRQCHFGCVLVGIEHGVHEREARVALDAGGVVALAVLARFCQFVSTIVYGSVVCSRVSWRCVCIVMLREVPFTRFQVLASIFSTRHLSETEWYV